MPDGPGDGSERRDDHGRSRSEEIHLWLHALQAQSGMSAVMQQPPNTTLPAALSMKVSGSG